MTPSDGLPRLSLPLDRARARTLVLGDLVLLDGEMVITAGFPTHQRLLAGIGRAEKPPLDLAGAAFVHMGICCREDGDRLEPLYVNPTTSTRFNTLMPDIIRHFRLSAIGGKGGLSAASVEAMREVGCVYFSIVGGASALLSAAVETIVETAWDDLIMQFRLTRIRVSGFGPVTVAIDAHGNSLYESLQASAEARMPAILDAVRRQD
ncbi:L(+)-tartrate dehydratase subunit beta [bacterium YEK0313]|nr:L(+)-tartrate dehydratase subunit beta [bacterium YEK0313]